uniref:Uncharacterized protein n=1 Tax=Amphilophus citrinellus TaxID=61819 RepID=A0A3Q0RG09_AMPCI
SIQSTLRQLLLFTGPPLLAREKEGKRQPLNTTMANLSSGICDMIGNLSLHCSSTRGPGPLWCGRGNGTRDHTPSARLLYSDRKLTVMEEPPGNGRPGILHFQSRPTVTKGEGWSVPSQEHHCAGWGGLAQPGPHQDVWSALQGFWKTGNGGKTWGKTCREIGDRPGLESVPPAPQSGICMWSPAPPLSHPGTPGTCF